MRTRRRCGSEAPRAGVAPAAAHGATRAANLGASFLGLIPGVGLAALAVKAGTKTATLATGEAKRSPAEEHALNQARWEVMGCEGEAM